MRIITVSRQFGSGGRELGKRLADALGVPCYDKEIIAEIAKLQGITPEHVQRISETDVRQIYAATIGRSFLSPVYIDDQPIQLISAQQEVIERLASQGDCVVIGQNSDIILSEYNPLNIFVYADEQARLQRCMAHIRPDETEKSIRTQMKKIDKTRASNRRILTDKEWGKPESYHMCVNTSGFEIKALVPIVAEYAKMWFELKK